MAIARKDEMRNFLLNIARKGFLETLEYINKNPQCHYNDVLRYLLENKILDGRAYVTKILNTLIETGLVNRKVDDKARPIRTSYKITKTGNATLKALENVEKEIKIKG